MLQVEKKGGTAASSRVPGTAEERKGEHREEDGTKSDDGRSHRTEQQRRPHVDKQTAFTEFKETA